MKKVLCSAMVLILLVSAVYGVKTKKSYTNYVSVQTDYSDVTVFEEAPALLSDDSMSAVRDSKERVLSAEVIARVRFSGKREQSHYATKSLVTVTEMIKGDAFKAGDSFFLFEPSWFGYNQDQKYVYYMRYSRLLPMKENTEYIVFANHVKYDDSYIKTLAFDEYKYADRECPFFEVNYTSPVIVDAKSHSFPVSYGDVADSEFLCCSDYQLTEMNAFKREIFDELGM